MAMFSSPGDSEEEYVSPVSGSEVWFLHVDLYPHSAMWKAQAHYKIFLVVHKKTSDDISFVILEMYLSQPLTKKSDDQITFYIKAETMKIHKVYIFFTAPGFLCFSIHLCLP